MILLLEVNGLQKHSICRYYPAREWCMSIVEIYQEQTRMRCELSMIVRPPSLLYCRNVFCLFYHKEAATTAEIIIPVTPMTPAKEL